MAEFPYMPMYWDAYFGDTQHLTCLEHGAYLQILGAMWRAGGSLPSDDQFLSRLTGLKLDRWRRIKPTIMGFMHPILGDRITQDKLLEARSQVSRLSKSQSSRSRARWLKHKALPDAAGLIRQSPGNANQIKIENPLSVQSSTPGEKESGSAEKQGAVVPTVAALPGKDDAIPITSALLNTRMMRRRRA